MFNKAFPLVVILFLLLRIDPVGAQPPVPNPVGVSGPNREVIVFKTAWSQDRLHAGGQIVLAVRADIAPGFHIHPNAAQLLSTEDFSPYPTSIQVRTSSEELIAEPVQYPPARQVNVNYRNGNLPAFEGSTIFHIPLRARDRARPGRISVVVEFDYQPCDAQTCLFPRKAEINETIEVVAAGVPVTAINGGFFSVNQGSAPPSTGVQFDLFGWRFAIDVSSWWGFLLLMITASLGGLLLNFTPCVLPLIPIKIMSLAEAAGNRGRCALLGITTSAGIVAFWLGMGAMIAWIKEFTAINQLFQFHAFTVLVGIVIALMAFGMCGLFSVRLPGFFYKINPRQDSLLGSFALGIMTAILSTPCTAPFMGAAAAWAATQHYSATLAAFAAIGTGMALPYLILAAMPQLVEKMPRSGPVSELIKQLMGLLMLAAASYFLGIGLSGHFTVAPDPPSRMYWWLVMAWSAAAGLWLSYRIVSLVSSKGTKIGLCFMGFLVFALSLLGALHLTKKEPIAWIYYTPARLEEAFNRGKIVVMDFTAEWCLNCKALEETVLHNPKITKLLASGDIAAIKVDITGDYPAGKAKLAEAGRLTIPLLVIYGPDGQEVFKSDFYTGEQIIEAVERARAAPQEKTTNRMD